MISAQTSNSAGQYRIDEIDIGTYFIQFLTQSTGLELLPGSGLNENAQTPSFNLNAGQDKFLSTAFIEPMALGLNNLFRLGSYFYLSPNIVSHSLTIHSLRSIHEPMQYQIIDINGRVQSSGSLSALKKGPLEWDISHLTSGIYMLRLEGKSIFQVEKFVKI